MSQAPAIETASPRRGRRPVTVHTQDTLQQIEEAQQELAPVVSAIREQSVSMPRAEMVASMTLAQGLGMFKAFNLVNEFSGLARVKWLVERKESEDYKGISVVNSNGEKCILNTFDDLCEYLGISRTKAYEDIQNISKLGEEFMSTAEALGLGYRDLRLLRKGVAGLPAEERQAILDEVKNAEGPEELKDRLQDLRAELAAAKIHEKELTETAQAREKVYQQKTEKLEELETRLERLNSLRPDDKARALDELNGRAVADVDNACRNILVEVMALCALAANIMRDDRATEATAAYVHQRSSLLADRIAEAMLGAGIDVDLRMRFELSTDDAITPASTTDTDSSDQD